MRRRYLFDETAAEKTERLRVDAAIDAWWSAFKERTDDLSALFSRKKLWDLPAWMQTHLSSISPELMWEFGPGLLGGHRLVITPESSHHLRPLVTDILDRAPKIDGWEFYPYRLPDDVNGAKQMVEARKGTRLEDMRFAISKGESNCVDVRCLAPPDYPEEKLKITGFVALEALLGEELLDRWIGYIDHEMVSQFASDSIEPERLPSEMRRCVDGIIAGLPDSPWLDIAEDAKWAVFKLQPESGPADYPAREDLLTQASAYPALHQHVFQGLYFDSSQFSKCGETFAFVKIDGADGLPEWGFKDRGDIEDALVQALESARLGTVVGGGSGLRYSYVDLALFDVSRATPIIRETLARGGVSVRSWLLFFDSNFSAEWIGIHPDTPPPPAAAV